MSTGLLRSLCLAVAIAAPSAGAAAAEGWIPIGPSGVGTVIDLSAGGSAVYAATCNGVYRSDDDGSSWQESGLRGECILRLAADRRSNTIYAIQRAREFVPAYPDPSFLAPVPQSFDDTLWVSHDGGESWSQAPFLGVTSVAVDLSQPDTAYVAAFFQPLQVTHDSGATWTPLPQYPAGSVARLTVDARDGVVYAAGPGPLFAASDGVWSNPIADSITAVCAGSGPDGAVYAAGPQQFCQKTTANPQWICSAFPGSNPTSVLELPGSESEARRILVAGFDGVRSSDDGGATWSLEAGSPVGLAEALGLDPSGGVVFAGNDAGVYRSADRGSTWTNSSAGLRAAWIRALVLDPSNPSTIWAGAEGLAPDTAGAGPGLFRSRDAGGSWTSVPGVGRNSVLSLAIDPSDPLKVYSGAWGWVSHSENGGASWSASSLSGAFVFGVAVDPASSSTVWAAPTRGSGLSRSNDSGHSWTPVASVAHDVYSLLFDSRRPGTIYAGSDWEDGGSYYPFGSGGSIYSSSNGGATWARTSEDLGAAVLSIAIDPFSDSVVYAGTGSGDVGGTILRSPDAGVTWERWDTQYAGHAVLALVADPVRSGRLYLASWNGVYRSVDSGRSWDYFSEGLAPSAALGLAVSPDGRWLYAGTDGSGVFERDLEIAVREPPTTVEQPRTTRDVPPRAPP